MLWLEFLDSMPPRDSPRSPVHIAETRCSHGVTSSLHLKFQSLTPLRDRPSRMSSTLVRNVFHIRRYPLTRSQAARPRTHPDIEHARRKSCSTLSNTFSIRLKYLFLAPTNEGPTSISSKIHATHLSHGNTMLPRLLFLHLNH